MSTGKKQGTIRCSVMCHMSDGGVPAVVNGGGSRFGIGSRAAEGSLEVVVYMHVT